MEPFCSGIRRSLPEVWHSRFEDEPQPEFFHYDCLGYSIYLDEFGIESSSDTWKRPYCVGLSTSHGTSYVIISTGGPSPVAPPTVDLPAHDLNNIEGAREVRKPHRPEPIQHAENDFLTRLSRNADRLVSWVKNKLP